MNWRKASYSGQQSACIEVARISDGAAIRDSKDRDAGYLTANHRQWSAFLHAIKTDRYGG